MNTCKICGESPPDMINDICIGCLAARWGDILAASDKIMKKKTQDSVTFVDLRNQGTGWNFALFNKNTNKFTAVYGKCVWCCFSDLELDIRSESDDFCQDPMVVIDWYKERCPGWVML